MSRGARFWWRESAEEIVGYLRGTSAARGARDGRRDASARALAEHTYAQRAAEVDEILRARACARHARGAARSAGVGAADARERRA